MGIKEAYKRIDDMETKAIEDYTTHYLKYEEGVYDALREVLEIIEEECPEVKRNRKMEQNRLDDLIDDIHKKGMSICEFCKNNDYCKECSEITKPPTPLYAFCKVFYKDCLEEATE